MEYSKEIEVATTLGNITIPPLSENISIKAVLKGCADESTNVEVYLAHLDKTVSVRIPNNVSLGKVFT